MKEIWEDIKGYEGYYQISNYGRVKSLSRLKITGNIKGIKKELMLKLGDNRGYKVVTLQVDKKRKTYRVHRLVAEAFIPNPNDLPEINHIDEDKGNNCVNNLEWCTRIYNVNYGTCQIRRVEKTDYSNNGETTKKRHGKKVKGTNKKNNEVEVFVSLNEAQKVTNIDNSSISKCCYKIKSHLSAGGYFWEFITDEEYDNFKRM